MSARPGVPDSTTRLPIADLEDPVGRRAGRRRRDAGRDPGRRRGRRAGRRRRPARPVRRPRPRASVPCAPLGCRAPGLEPLPRRPTDARRAAARSPTGSPPRTREVYGLTDTLAAPLTSDGEVVGAIILSHRTAGDWSPTTRRLLTGAAVEASSALSRAYSQLAAETQASTDALTGLPNRRYFDEFCGLLARRRRSGDAVGVLMIDIDKFKVLNDTYGHATGRRGPARGRWRDRGGRPRGRRPGPLRRRGVRGPAAQPEPGDRARGRRARPGVGRGARPAAGSACAGVSVSVGVAVARQADQPIARPHRRGRPGALSGQARGPRPGRRRLTPATSAARMSRRATAAIRDRPTRPT